MMVVNLKPLYPDAFIPRYETAESAGVDLSAYLWSRDMPITIQPGQWKLIPTGIAVSLPKGMEMQIRPRSGLAWKHGVVVLNSPGTVDSDYRGEIGVLLVNLGNKPFTVNHGDRIAQAVFQRYEKVFFRFVQELDETERGAGGFGSTGI